MVLPISSGLRYKLYLINRAHPSMIILYNLIVIIMKINTKYILDCNSTFLYYINGYLSSENFYFTLGIKIVFIFLRVIKK